MDVNEVLTTVEHILLLLTMIAALTPTDKDDYVIGRARNLFNKILHVIKKLQR